MQKEFVTYQQALALKELGFDEPCFGFYYVNPLNSSYRELKYGMSIFKKTSVEITKGHILAPLYQQAFRWFRDKYKLHSYIHSDYSWNISGGIWDLNGHIGSRYDWDSDTYPSYEEAEQGCLDKLIEIVKNK